MSKLRTIMGRIVSGLSREDSVALLLSAGIDSISTGIVCEETGRRVHAYTFEIQGFRSEERERVEAIARLLGWPLTVLTVPTRNLANDFKRLALRHGCKTKVHFEVSWPLLHVFQAISEKEIWSGFNADDHLGNTREVILEQARFLRAGVDHAERKRRFDEYKRCLYEKFDAPNSADSWRCARELAAHFGKDLLEPFQHPAMREYFFAFDHETLSDPGKPFLRQEFSDRLTCIPDDLIAKGKRLQKSSRVDELFIRLIDNPDINRFETKYSTVQAICARWASEAQSNKLAHAPDIDGAPPAPRVSVRPSREAQYVPYSLADVREAAANAKFTFISMFAGGGGSSAGLCLAGGTGLIASEFVPEAARTYGRNFPNCIVDDRDIREIIESHQSTMAFLAAANLRPGELDVLDGSPPCSEFSTAGSGIGDQEVYKPYSDVVQNRIASLIFDHGKLIHAALPKVFVVENVPAIASRGREVFERFLHAARFFWDGRRAYYVNAAVLSADDYGVPQKRKRLFFIGVREDVGNAVGFDSDEAVRDAFPAPTQPRVSVRSALADLHQTENEVWPWLQSALTTQLAALIRLLPKCPAKPTRLVHIFPDYKKHYTLTRCSYDRPAPTMVVTGQKPDALTGAIHPEYDRKFTIAELKRLTALPDDFVLTGSLSQAAERVCRMVPPLLSKAIAESVYEKILSPYKEKEK